MVRPTSNASKDVVGSLAEETVAKDNGVFARLGWVNKTIHGRALDYANAIAIDGLMMVMAAKLIDSGGQAALSVSQCSRGGREG